MSPWWMPPGAHKPQAKPQGSSTSRTLLGLALPRSPFASRAPRVPVPKHVLYRGKGMLLVRFLVRAKVFQLLGVFTATLMVSAAMAAVGGSMGAVCIRGSVHGGNGYPSLQLGSQHSSDAPWIWCSAGA